MCSTAHARLQTCPRRRVLLLLFSCRLHAQWCCCLTPHWPPFAPFPFRHNVDSPIHFCTMLSCVFVYGFAGVSFAVNPKFKNLHFNKPIWHTRRETVWERVAVNRRFSPVAFWRLQHLFRHALKHWWGGGCHRAWLVSPLGRCACCRYPGQCVATRIFYIYIYVTKGWPLEKTRRIKVSSRDHDRFVQIGGKGGLNVGYKKPFFIIARCFYIKEAERTISSDYEWVLRDWS